MTPEELGQRRRRLGLSQAQLGNALGVAGNTVARWERGELPLRRPGLVSLALERLEQESPVRSRHPHDASSVETTVPAHERRHSQGKSRHNLPLELNQFVGREAEVAEVRGLLRSTRLLTLTGAGGVGKTRLARQVARDVLADFADGVWLVELAPLADPSLVPCAFALVLGVYERPDQPLEETLVDVLLSQRVLLLLDNCEHLVMACAALVERLLSHCPYLRALATSREQLGIGGETTWRVPSLSLPSAERPASVENLACSDAVKLFTQRASEVLPGFGLTRANAAAIAQVCQRLDGIPLALELAAARVNALAVEQIASRLDDSLSLLIAGTRTASDRQRTLRGTLDWSYKLLSEPERGLFARLAVFAGGWTLEAAEAVCADATIKRTEVLKLLSNLVNKSLVVAENHGQEMRYRFLDPLRAYAREKLDASGDIRRVQSLHRDWYLQQAERFEIEWRGPLQRAWLDKLDREQDNVRVAQRFCLHHGEITKGLRMAGALPRFWDFRGRAIEGRAWLNELLGAVGQSIPDAVMAKALSAAGYLAAYQGDAELAESQLTEALRLWRKLGDGSGVASTLIGLGSAAHVRHDDSRAEALWLEGLGVARAIGDRSDAYWALHILAGLALRQKDYGRAQALYDESLFLKRQQDDGFGVASSLEGLAKLAWLRGEHRQALTLAREGLRLMRDLGHWRTIVLDLLILAHVTADCGAAEQSVRLFGAAETLQENLGDRRSFPTILNVDPSCTEHSLANCRARLAPPAFEAAHAAGKAMSTEEAIAFALDATPSDESETVQNGAVRTASHIVLTEREKEVLCLLADGKSNKEIAAQLTLSARTVERHVSNLYSKIGARNRAEATAYAVRVFMV
jgi:predicted ATPase/DNA-binding CsgD family transcriptional regulator